MPGISRITVTARWTVYLDHQRFTASIRAGLAAFGNPRSTVASFFARRATVIMIRMPATRQLADIPALISPTADTARMTCMKLPRAILFDLDDTILVAFGPAQSQWQRTSAAFADQLGPIEATVIAAAIEAASTELWADPARHKYWRRRIVATAFAALAAAGHPVPTE